MRVNVYIARDDEVPQKLLVMPYGKAGSIPDHLRHMDWRNLATTTTEDALLAAHHQIICAQLHLSGYAVVQPSSTLRDR